MSSSTARVIGNDLTLATGGKVKNCTAGSAAGEVMEYDQVRTMVATGATDNLLLRADGTGGHLMQPCVSVGCSDTGVLTGTSGGAQGAGTMTAPLGATSADANVTTGAGGADDTFDFALTDNVNYELKIITVAKDQTTGKRFMRTSRVLCYAASGASNMFSQDAPVESLWDADAGSLFTAASGAITKTGASIRVTHKAVANAVKWSTHVQAWVIPDAA